MIALILFIVFGLLFGYFATLNTSLVFVHFGSYVVKDVPMYMLVLASVGLGVLFASLFYFFKSIFSRMTLGKKESQLTEALRENTELTKKLHKMELENTRLKSKNGDIAEDEESI